MRITFCISEKLQINKIKFLLKKQDARPFVGLRKDSFCRKKKMHR